MKVKRARKKARLLPRSKPHKLTNSYGSRSEQNPADDHRRRKLPNRILSAVVQNAADKNDRAVR